MTAVETISRMASIILGLAIVVLGANVLIAEPMAIWTATSLVVSLVIFVMALTFATLCSKNHFATLTGLYATILVGRLFGTMHIADSATTALASSDVLLVAETGPGQPLIILLAFGLAAVFGARLIISAISSLPGRVVSLPQAHHSTVGHRPSFAPISD